MKTLSSLISIFLITLMAFNSVWAGKEKDEGFQGTITYSIKAEGEMDAQTKAQMPTEMKISYKGTLSRTEAITPMGSQVVITDKETKETIILLDIMGTKVAVKTTKEDYEKALEENPATSSTKLIEETKKIAGYNCKKAEISDGEDVVTVWYTEEIAIENPNWGNPDMKDIPGVLMEFSNTKDEITTIYTATEIKKAKIKDYLFKVPEGYQEMSPNELREMFGG